MLEHYFFCAKIDEIHSVLEWIEQKILSFGFAKKERNQIQLAIEEVLINIIQHGYGKKEGKIDIAIDMNKEKELKILVKDKADFFDPTSLDLKEIEKKKSFSLEERKEGELGIFFIRNLMDEVLYERKKDTNYLLLKKYKK